MKQISSLDLHFLAKELDGLVGSRVDRIYSQENELYFQFHKSNKGKVILRVIPAKALFVVSEKNADDEPSHLCTVMRKHLEGKLLKSLRQIEPERILEMVFGSKENERVVFIELFGKGNIVLCNEGRIIDAMTKHVFKDRSIIPGQDYKHPTMNLNIFELDDMSTMLEKSGKDKIVTLLATELGLGGTYAEEICLLAGIEKDRNPGTIKKEEQNSILKSLKKIIGRKIEPRIYYEGSGALDVAPVNLEVYKGKTMKEFSSFSEALNQYFSFEMKIMPKKESKYAKQIEELKRIIAEQESTIASLHEKEDEHRKRADLIYSNYQLIKEIFGEIAKAKEKHSWEEIKKRLKGHKMIKDLDTKDKRITIEL